jgi:hypothetical protein
MANQAEPRRKHGAPSNRAGAQTFGFAQPLLTEPGRDHAGSSSALAKATLNARHQITTVR